MINKIINKKYLRTAYAMLLVFLFLLPATYYLPHINEAYAQEDQLTLSITPPLFQLNISPGQAWASQVKITNVNPYDITLYASVVDFDAEGEAGGAIFTPILGNESEMDGSTMAHWVEVTSEPIFIKKEKSVDIPFFVQVPDNVSPGGHYAAILIGTQPIDEGEGAFVRVSSYVTSLLFANVAGEVREDGRIREFSIDKAFYEEPDVDFTLRFENLGNVHLQPRGEIKIFNMWGKERGIVEINQNTNFGNVLPQSIRKFVFKWVAPDNFFEVGRYRAEITLTYGNNLHKTDFRTLDFWVVPLKPTLITLGILILFILFFAWIVRMYVRRAIKIQAQILGVSDLSLHKGSFAKTLKAPAQDALEDIKTAQQKNSKELARIKKNKFFKRLWTKILYIIWIVFKLSLKYRMVFLSILVIIFLASLLLIYLNQALLPERSFEIIIQQK